MSKLVQPREIREQKASQRKDSNAKKSERKLQLQQLVRSPGYAILKSTALSIAGQYRSIPGGTREEDDSYLTHCKILWAYNMMFGQIEAQAKTAPKEQEVKDDDW